MQTDIVDKIMRYEGGDMNQGETIAFFQELVNDGTAWTLQGHYGRTAKWLLDQGFIKAKVVH